MESEERQPPVEGDVEGLRLSVKMLDSTMHSITVPGENPSVTDLRRVVATKTGVAESRQRLIFRGTMLKDDKTLEDYRMEEGNVIHLVVKPEGSSSSPGAGASAPAAASTAQAGNRAQSTTRGQNGNQQQPPFVFRAMPVPPMMNRSHESIASIATSVLQQLGLPQNAAQRGGASAAAAAMTASAHTNRREMGRAQLASAAHESINSLRTALGAEQFPNLPADNYAALQTLLERYAETNRMAADRAMEIRQGLPATVEELNNDQDAINRLAGAADNFALLAQIGNNMTGLTAAHVAEVRDEGLRTETERGGNEASQAQGQTGAAGTAGQTGNSGPEQEIPVQAEFQFQTNFGQEDVQGRDPNNVLEMVVTGLTPLINTVVNWVLASQNNGDQNANQPTNPGENAQTGTNTPQAQTQTQNDAQATGTPGVGAMPTSGMEGAQNTQNTARDPSAPNMPNAANAPNMNWQFQNTNQMVQNMAPILNSILRSVNGDMQRQQQANRAPTNTPGDQQQFRVHINFHSGNPGAPAQGGTQAAGNGASNTNRAPHFHGQTHSHSHDQNRPRRAPATPCNNPNHNHSNPNARPAGSGPNAPQRPQRPCRNPNHQHQNNRMDSHGHPRPHGSHRHSHGRPNPTPNGNFPGQPADPRMARAAAGVPGVGDAGRNQGDGVQQTRPSAPGSEYADIFGRIMQAVNSSVNAQRAGSAGPIPSVGHLVRGAVEGTSLDGAEEETDLERLMTIAIENVDVMQLMNVLNGNLELFRSVRQPVRRYCLENFTNGDSSAAAAEALSTRLFSREVEKILTEIDNMTLMRENRLPDADSARNVLTPILEQRFQDLTETVLDDTAVPDDEFPAFAKVWLDQMVGQVAYELSNLMRHGWPDAQNVVRTLASTMGTQFCGEEFGTIIFMGGDLLLRYVTDSRGRWIQYLNSEAEATAGQNEGQEETMQQSRSAPFSAETVNPAGSQMETSNPQDSNPADGDWNLTEEDSNLQAALDAVVSDDDEEMDDLAAEMAAELAAEASLNQAMEEVEGEEDGNSNIENGAVDGPSSATQPTDVFEQFFNAEEANHWRTATEADARAQAELVRRPLSRAYRSGETGKIPPPLSPLTDSTASDMAISSLKKASKEAGASSESVQRACDELSAAGVGSLYTRQLRRSINSRISSDPDFDPDQFPNASKRFRPN